MKTNELRSLAKSSILEKAKQLSTADVTLLIETLSEKDDNLRYNAFLLLQANSTIAPNVYEHWSKLDEKLENSNSYQRSVGLMLIAENVKWDKENRLKLTITKYLACCTDEKFITARQAIQGLAKILDATDRYDGLIKKRLMTFQLTQYKMNQQKLLKKDIAKIFEVLEKKV